MKMYTSALKPVILTLIFVTSLTVATTDDTFECSETFTDLTAQQGFLSIKRNASSCGFLANGTSVSFAIQTDSLLLYFNDSLTLEPMDTVDATRTITGPQDDGYIVVGFRPKLTFRFDKSNQNNSTMRLRFFQNSNPPIPVSGDKKGDLLIQSFGMKQDLSVSVQKSLHDTVYLEEVDDSKFGHYLIEENNKVINLGKAENRTFTLRISPVLKSCSGYHETKDENSFEIDGPNATTVDKMEKYKCVHIFKTLMSDRAHFDVDFKDFIEMVDLADELSISDGSQSLSITKSSYRYYKELVPKVSFSGQNLVVVYDSPQKVNRLSIQVKLTVHARSLGGIVDTFDYKFDVPKTGSAYYSFKAPPNSSGGVVLEFIKFAGANITVYNRQNEVISLDGEVTAVMPFTHPDDNVSVLFSTDSKTKVSGTVNYKQGTGCGDTLFDSSGTISIGGSNKTCHWFLGSSSNVIKVNLNDLRTDGSLEIYSVKRRKKVFERKNVAPTDVLPPIIVDGQAYLRIVLGKVPNSFEASVSPVTETLVSSSTSHQTNIISTGYPVYYWSDVSEAHSIDFKNKEAVLSVADLDLRTGENMSINSTAVSNGVAPVDFYVKNETVTVAITRSASEDFNPRRGYNLVTTEFQTVITADMKKNTVKTPKNLTSLLLKIPGAVGKRLTYGITFSNSGTDYVIKVIDSMSLMGRLVDNAEKFNGSTTANVLLVSLRSTKDKVFLPELTVSYGEIPCNQTRDHVCDRSTRCVPDDKMCKGVSYCADGSDLKVPCSNGPVPPPKVIENGVSGVTVFILSVLMFTIGAITALYGPDLYKNFETRYRSGQYTTFQSAE